MKWGVVTCKNNQKGPILVSNSYYTPNISVGEDGKVSRRKLPKTSDIIANYVVYEDVETNSDIPDAV